MSGFPETPGDPGAQARSPQIALLHLFLPSGSGSGWGKYGQDIWGLGLQLWPHGVFFCNLRPWLIKAEK